jgi:methyl-accepting chemotaxis protein
MFKKLTLKAKLGLGFGSSVLLLVAVGVIGFESTLRTSDASDRAVINLQKDVLTVRMTAALEKQTTAVRGYMLKGDESLLKHDEEGQQEFKEAVDKLSVMVSTEEGKKLLAEVSTGFRAYRTVVDQEIALQRGGKHKEALDLCFSSSTSQLRNDLRETLSRMEDFETKLATDAVTDGNKVESSTRLLLMTCAILGCVIAIIIAIALIKFVTHATGQMVSVVDEIGHNNLTIPDIEVVVEDELGRAGIALNEMKRNLSGIVQTIARSAEQLASASEELSSGATQTAESARNQSNQTVQATTAMHEMSSTVQQISEHSQTAAETSRQAAQVAKKGGEVVEAVLSSMRNIADATEKTASQVTALGKGSEEIGKIIAVIDDIADQTNLLALNAAIEAARAGEQGRGFAVVADEVRKLAERTTKATKEIAAMIQSIQTETHSAVQAMERGKQEVQAGVQKTSASGESLREIITMSEKVGDMIAQIATAATEQSAATEQVNANVSQISSSAQESAAAAEQSARACTDLSSLALDLQKVVGQFRIDSSQALQEHAHRVPAHKPKAAAAVAGV